MADSSVQELIIKYRADVSDLTAKVTIIENKLRAAGKAGEDAGKKTEQAFKQASGAVSTVPESLKKVGAAIGAAFAVERIIEFGKETIHAFEQAELQAQKLRSAVSSNGGLEQDFNNLIEQSKELQKVTIFGSESVQQAQTLALQFGLTAEQVEILLPKVTDLASATGQDLSAALESVLRGVEGNGRALKLYGINVDSTKGKAENFADIQEQITKKFAGQAAVIGNTHVGAIKKLGNAYDELKIRIGGMLTPVESSLAEIAESILKITEIPLSETLEKEAQSFNIARTQLSGLNVGSSERVEIIKKLQLQYPGYLGNIDAETVSNEELNRALDKVNNSIIVKIALQKADEDIQEQQEETGEALRKTAEARAILERELTTIRKRSNAEELKQKLDGLPLDVQANELLQGRIKLNGISAASLGNLAKALARYNLANVELSRQSVTTNDLIAARIQEEKDLLEIYGLEKDAKSRTETQAQKEEAAALARLKKISALTTAELLKIRTILKGFNDLDAQDAITNIEKELDARKKAGEKEFQQRQQALEELHALEQSISDDNLKVRNAEASKVLEIEKNKQLKLRDLVTKFQQANGGTFDDVIKKFNETGVIDLDKVQSQLSSIKAPDGEIDKFNEAVKNVNNTFDLLIKKERDAFNIKNLKDDLQATLDSLDFGADNQTFTITQKFESESSGLTDEQRKDAEVKLQQDLLNVKLDADEKKLEETKKTNDAIKNIDASLVLPTLNLEKQITQDKQDELDARIKAQKEAAAQQLKTEQELTQKKKDLIKEVRDAAISGAEQIIEDVINAQSEEQIKSIEATRDFEIQAIDDRIKANEEKHRLGEIGDRKAEQVSKELLDEKAKAEADAANRIRLIKRKQFQQDQIAAAVKVEIAALVASAESGFNPILTALYEALALIQIGIIASEPNPYKKGTKSAKEGTAIVGEEGPELVVMSKGAKVLTAEKTKKHADAVDAMIDGKFEEHVRKVFVEPELVRQAKKLTKNNISEQEISEIITKSISRIFKTVDIDDRNYFIQPQPSIAFEFKPVKKVIRTESFDKERFSVEHINTILSKLNVVGHLKEATQKHETRKHETFAQNIANAFNIHKEFSGMKATEYSRIADEQRRKGIRIRNAGDIVDPILEHLNNNKVPSFVR